MFFPIRDVFTALQWSPHQNLLGAVGERNFLVYDPLRRMRVCRTSTREESPYSLECLSWSPIRGRTVLAVGGREGVVHLWDVATEQPAGTYSNHSPEVLALPATVHPYRRSIRALDWSPDGLLIASAADDCTVRIWWAATGETRFISDKEPTRSGFLLAWLDQKTIISSQGSEMIVWDACSGSVLRTIPTKLAWDGHAYASRAVRARRPEQGNG